jgi:hypothetical protein
MTASPPSDDDGKWSKNQDKIFKLRFHYTAFCGGSTTFFREFRAQDWQIAAKTNSFCAT